jgi:hypothetical protein
MTSYMNNDRARMYIIAISAVLGTTEAKNITLHRMFLEDGAECAKELLAIRPDSKLIDCEDCTYEYPLCGHCIGS